MLLGDILVSKGLVKREQVDQAIERQNTEGGRLGENLIAMGVISAEGIDEVMNEWPQQPRNLDDIDVDESLLLGLIAKGMYSQNLELPSQIARAVALPGSMVTVLMKELVDRNMVEASGQASSGTGVIEVKEGNAVARASTIATVRSGMSSDGVRVIKDHFGERSASYAEALF